MTNAIIQGSLGSAISVPAESGAEPPGEAFKHFWYILSPGNVSAGNEFGSFDYLTDSSVSLLFVKSCRPLKFSGPKQLVKVATA